MSFPDLTTALCAVHPSVRAAFICRRCGAFACDGCRSPQLHLCRACAARPEALKQVTTGPLIRAGFQLVWGSRWAALGFAALATIPSVFLTLAVNTVVARSSDTADSRMIVLPALHPVALVALGLVMGAFYILLQGAQFVYFGARERGEPVSLAEAMRSSAARFFPMVGTYILFALASLAGVALCVIPGLVIAFRWMLTPAATVLGAEDPITSIRRSWRLTANRNWAHLASAVVALAFIGSVLSGFIQGLLTGFGVPPDTSLGRSYATGVLGTFCLMPALAAQAAAYVRLTSRQRMLESEPAPGAAAIG